MQTLAIQSPIIYNNGDKAIMGDLSDKRKIEYAIENADGGTVFIITDFTNTASYDCAKKVLQRLAEEGKLRRIARGIYEKPQYSEFLREYIVPSPDKIAHAIARNFGWTIVPCGDTALNMLGLSTQVPSVWLYVSDGPYKVFSFGSTTIKFKHSTNRDISKYSYKTALVIQAIKTLGKDNVSENAINVLRSKLTEEEKQTMLSEANTATAWVYEIIKKICGGEQ